MADSSNDKARPGAERAVDVTARLEALRDGRPGAEQELYDLVYLELKRLARAQLGAHGRVGATLDTTVLVHEAYLRMAAPAGFRSEDRAHFFNLAARIMRHVIVDFARHRDAVKRGAGAPLADYAELAERVADPEGTFSVEVLDLDRALGALEASSPDLVQLIELRFFTGLTLEEIEPVVGRSVRTLKRDWRRARAYLLAAIDGNIPLTAG